MALDEYQRTLAVTVRPPGLLEPRIDVADDDGRVTDPPTARRSESLARMGAVGAATPVPPRASAPPAYYPSDIPRAPAVPMLSIPVGPDSHTSGSERFAVSTDRPTELGLAAELADRSRVLRPAMPKARVAELALDHRSGFLLSRIDGKARIEEVLDVSGMAESEALSILGDLLRRGVVVFETAGRYTGRGSR